MPRSYVTNDGMGPYAIFYCDRCDREYRSQPNFTTTVTENVKRGALGGFLRNVPIVGDQMANETENDRYRTTMTKEEIDSAWAEVQQYFRECPTCHEIVCIPDFDEVSGFCDQDSPRRAEVAQAEAEQAVGFMKGVADAFGISDAMKQGMQQAQEQQAQQAPQTAAPAPAQPATAGVKCASCGATVPEGQKFCGSCGTPVPQAVACPNCGTMTDQAFCGSCGAKVR
ncbi:MAG: zinc ribbon domain-containing protein [Actinomycetota bacterium]|nr:zinc ribbon domain-containing protein [Actinomycetota bacterium]